MDYYKSLKKISNTQVEVYCSLHNKPKYNTLKQQLAQLLKGAKILKINSLNDSKRGIRKLYVKISGDITWLE